MTTAEVRKKISNSKESDWFEAVELTIKYNHINVIQPLKGFSSIHKFVSQQATGWGKINTIPSVLASSKQHFVNLKNRLDQFLNARAQDPISNIKNYWSQEQSALLNNKSYFTYDCPETEFLLQMHQEIPNAVAGAHKFVTQTSPNFNNQNEHIGWLLAYEFKLKDKSEIAERRDKEKASLSKIKNDFREQLSDSETQLTEHLTNSIDEYKTYIGIIDELKSEKENLFNNWYEGTKDEIGIKDRVADLENTYEELLRLKKPAEYWKTRATKLNKEGWKAIYWLIGLVVFACTTLYLLLWLTPEGMLLSFVKGNAQAIKWSIVYITFISFLAYSIKAIHKVAFSSFHLSRDSEEREQLTYFYLALIKDNAVDEKDKNLILQSLFSRADTGLLKDDSGPTMPNDVAGKMFGK